MRAVLQSRQSQNGARFISTAATVESLIPNGSRLVRMCAETILLNKGMGVRQILILTATGTLSVLGVGCKTRNFGGEIKGALDKTEDFGPLPFNALEILKDDKLKPVVEYPKNYKGKWNIVLGPNGDGIREVPSDGVFFPSRKDWFTTMEYDQQKMGGGADRGDGVFEPVDEGGRGGLKRVDMPTAEPTSYARVTADDLNKKKRRRSFDV